MSAAPRFNAAAGRLMLRRVAFARLERIREEQGAESYPDLSKLNPRSAEEIEKLLLLAALLERCHLDPVTELRRVLDKEIKRSAKEHARHTALLKAEDERRRAGRKARAPSNETHRKKLRLARAAHRRLQDLLNLCTHVVVWK